MGLLFREHYKAIYSYSEFSVWLKYSHQNSPSSGWRKMNLQKFLVFIAFVNIFSNASVYKRLAVSNDDYLSSRIVVVPLEDKLNILKNHKLRNRSRQRRNFNVHSRYHYDPNEKNMELRKNSNRNVLSIDQAVQ